MSEKDIGNLNAILDSCLKIERFTKHLNNADEFFQDEKTFDAVLINFVIIGESVHRLSDDLKQSHNNIPWLKIKGFRNIVVHDYFGVDAEEVWQIIEDKIPELILQIRKILTN
jgi:uncharacterized protein with HEPN domain